MVLWHPRTSWGLRNRIFSKKSGQKAPKTRLPPPLVSRLRDISRNLVKWGGSLYSVVFGTFFGCKRFLSDYMVPACPKYISGKLRSFSKNFSKNFFHTTLFENFLPTDASVANAKNQPSQGLGTPQNRPSAKKSIFSKSEISSPQSNHGKRNIKLMLVRP